MQASIAAIVPMRHHSERVKGKNYRMFNGKPLYHYIIERLLASKYLQKVVIDTDSGFIREDAAKYFPKVIVLNRPEHLQDGGIPMNDVLLHSTGKIEADFYLQTHSTNPLLTTETIDRGISLFLENYPVYDSLFSVTRWQTRFWDQLGRALNHNEAILLRTQDLPPVYEENSCMYLFGREILERKHNRVGYRPYLFEIDRHEAIDIDEELDFRIAEMIYQQKNSTSDN